MSPSIDQLLTITCSKGASDLHIKAGSFPFMRINGELQPMVEAQRLSAEDTLNMAFSIMNNRQKQRFSEMSEVDIAYGVSGLGRFRCNVFQQRGTVGMVLRVIPTTVRTAEELRDYETIETALTAAETGHLVLSTLHTLDATETVNRVVSVFPPHQQRAIRLQLASVLRAVVSMRLLRAAEPIQGRVPAVEVMIVTPYIRDCIIHGEKTALIRDAIAQGTSQYGMQTFDQSLFDLYSRGLITYEEALNGATNADEFKLRVSGIRSVTEQAREEMERGRKRPGTAALDANRPEPKQFVNWLLEGTEQVTR